MLKITISGTEEVLELLQKRIETDGLTLADAQRTRIDNKCYHRMLEYTHIERQQDDYKVTGIGEYWCDWSQGRAINVTSFTFEATLKKSENTPHFLGELSMKEISGNELSQLRYQYYKSAG